MTEYQYVAFEIEAIEGVTIFEIINRIRTKIIEMGHDPNHPFFDPTMYTQIETENRGFGYCPDRVVMASFDNYDARPYE